MKRITVYINPEDTRCREAVDFLMDSGVVFDIQDINDTPLDADQVGRLIGHLNPVHFLNNNNKAIEMLDLENEPINRPALFQQIAGQNELLQFPIITTNRLATVGFNVDCLRQMLQLSDNGDDSTEH